MFNTLRNSRTGQAIRFASSAYWVAAFVSWRLTNLGLAEETLGHGPWLLAHLGWVAAPIAFVIAWTDPAPVRAKPPGAE